MSCAWMIGPTTSCCRRIPTRKRLQVRVWAHMAAEGAVAHLPVAPSRVTAVTALPTSPGPCMPPPAVAHPSAPSPTASHLSGPHTPQTRTLSHSLGDSLPLPIPRMRCLAARLPASRYAAACTVPVPPIIQPYDARRSPPLAHILMPPSQSGHLAPRREMAQLRPAAPRRCQAHPQAASRQPTQTTAAPATAAVAQRYPSHRR